MKKLLSLLFALSLGVLVSGCGGETDPAVTENAAEKDMELKKYNDLDDDFDKEHWKSDASTEAGMDWRKSGKSDE